MTASPCAAALSFFNTSLLCHVRVGAVCWHQQEKLKKERQKMEEEIKKAKEDMARRMPSSRPRMKYEEGRDLR